MSNNLNQDTSEDSDIIVSLFEWLITSLSL